MMVVIAGLALGKCCVDANGSVYEHRHMVSVFEAVLCTL